MVEGGKVIGMGDTASGCLDGWRNRQGGMTGRGRQYGGRLMALVTGDPVVSSPEKPSLSCLYIYIYIYMYYLPDCLQTFPIISGTVNSPNDGFSGEFGGTGDKFLAVEILARSARFSPPPLLSFLSFVVRRDKFFNFTINLPLFYELQKKCFVQMVLLCLKFVHIILRTYV